MEKEKVQGVIEWPVPRSVKDVQKFLGLAKLLHEMMRKETK